MPSPRGNPLWPEGGFSSRTCSGSMYPAFPEPAMEARRPVAELPAASSYSPRSPAKIGQRVLLSDPLYAPIHSFLRQVPWEIVEAGIKGMRAFIFELRPESLESEGVVAALESRHGIEVETDLCDEPEAPLEAKEALYRISQEAPHNIVKHVRASNVETGMVCGSGGVTLEISDDGTGFDAEGAFPDHLGLRSMRERASRLGGTLEVKTAPDRGTHISTRIPI